MKSCLAVIFTLILHQKAKGARHGDVAFLAFHPCGRVACGAWPLWLPQEAPWSGVIGVGSSLARPGAQGCHSRWAGGPAAPLPGRVGSALLRPVRSSHGSLVGQVSPSAAFQSGRRTPPVEGRERGMSQSVGTDGTVPRLSFHHCQAVVPGTLNAVTPQREGTLPLGTSIPTLDVQPPQTVLSPSHGSVSPLERTC